MTVGEVKTILKGVPDDYQFLMDYVFVPQDQDSGDVIEVETSAQLDVNALNNAVVVRKG